MRVGDLDAFRGHFEPRALYFSRAFRLGRIPLLTFAITLANLAVFLLASRQGPIDAGVLIDYGAKSGPLLHDLGQWWRLLSANFVHRDWAHLGFNLFVLFHFGAAAENAYRRIDFVFIVLAAALGTTLLSYAMTDAISAGASGIGYGMLGSAVVFGLKYRKILPARYRGVLGGSVVPTVVVFLYIGWISSGVDNWGHVGGLLAGAFATSLFRPRLLGDPPSQRALIFHRLLPLALILAVVCLGGAVAGERLPRMVPVHSEALGLSIEVPAGWQKRGELVLDNGMPSVGRASLIAGARRREEPPDLDLALTSFVEREFVTKEEEGKLWDLELGSLRFAHVAGEQGLSRDLRFRVDGTAMVVRIHLFARGPFVYSLVLVRPERLPGYEPIFDRIVESARLVRG